MLNNQYILIKNKKKKIIYINEFFFKIKSYNLFFEIKNLNIWRWPLINLNFLHTYKKFF